MNNKKALLKKVKLILIVLLIFVGLAAASGIYTYYELNKVESGSLSHNNSDLGITDNTDNELKDKSITNIALFGVDSRDINSDKGSTSESIMILSIDKEHNKLKLTSIMRDTYVNVEDHGMTKITYAYAYGGPSLTVKIINQNFNMNIKDYITVDFFGLEKIIESVGGVQIDVEEDEVPAINSGVTGTSQIEKIVPTFIKTSGLQTLNASQAVAYSRIR